MNCIYYVHYHMIKFMLKVWNTHKYTDRWYIVWPGPRENKEICGVMSMGWGFLWGALKIL